MKKYCGTTVEAVDYNNPEHVKQRLAYISYRLKSGDSYAQYEKELDLIAGLPKEEERDEELEAKWESEYRKERGDA